ncbi:hypothetical protein SR39_24050 [Methylobacterium radiotolerans]|nr:hypothetical protein SR39_24050 [Methylobacterium radiotolerans]
MGHEVRPDILALLDIKQEFRKPLADAMGSIVADVLIGHRESRATSFSLNRNAYTTLRRYHPLMTYANVRQGVMHLEGAGLLKVERGKNWRDGGKGKQSRIKATDDLINRVGEQPAVSRRAGAEVLIMKDANKQIVGYAETERTIATRKDIWDQNEVLASAEIRLEVEDVNWTEAGLVIVPGLLDANGNQKRSVFIRPDHLELRRIANNGNWGEGMRWYGHFAQNLPKERRRQLTIGRMPVELIDFGASHPNLLYAQAGKILDGDAYDVPGFERDEIKLALLILINAGSRKEAVGAMAFRLADGETPESQTVTVRQDHWKHARRLLDAVRVRHEPITGSFCTGCGTRLQALEAGILSTVMRAARKRGIITVPVHDEIVVAAPEADLVRDLMVEKWVSACGAFPLL